jgi:quinohemoprotein ethanol dehydrogenase
MRRALAALAALALAACTAAASQQAAAPLAPAPANVALGAGEEWDNPAGDWAGSRYSRLTDITPQNVGQLGLAWEYDLGTARVQEATPVVVGGVMYHAGNLGRVYALDAATGRELWTFAPQVDMQINRAVCCDQANRGLAVRGHNRPHARLHHNRRARARGRPRRHRQCRRRVRRARLRHRLQHRRRLAGLALLHHPA